MLYEWEEDGMELDETEDPLDGLVERWDELTNFFGQTNGWGNYGVDAQLNAALGAGDIGKVVDLVENAQDEISREMAGRCLAESIKDATPADYATLLCCLPEGEYAGCCFVDVDWRVPNNSLVDRIQLQITGTLVSLAVAWNRPDILEMLLRKGHDVDGASFAASSALVHFTKGSMLGFQIRQKENRTISSVLFNGVMRYTEGGFLGDWLYPSVTPLALAILMGHEKCARILLDYGACVENEHGVSRMMNLVWREKDAQYMAVREAVLSHKKAARYRPVLSELTESSRKQFRMALRGYSYTREDYVQFLEELFREVNNLYRPPTILQHDWTEICCKLLEIGAVCPEVLASRQAMRLVFFCEEMEGFSLDPLFPFLKGRKVDLTSVLWLIPTIQTCRRLLSELSGNCELVMDRYGLIFPTQSVTRLKLLIKYVTMLSEKRTERISALTAAILRCNNAKLVRSSLENGVIPESTKDLLYWMQENPGAVNCREAILTTRRKESLVLENWNSSEEFGMEEPWWPVSVMLMGESVQCPRHLAPFLTGDLDEVKVQMSSRDEDGIVSIQAATRINMREKHIDCTNLCAAALAGQDKVIGLLLDEYSIPLDEGGVCTVCTDYMNCQAYLIDPVLAAALGEHWHTVKLLLERGARLNCDDPWIRELWANCRRTDPYEEVRFQLGDWAVTA